MEKLDWMDREMIRIQQSMADPTSDPTITEIAAIMSEYREPSTNWANMS
jgi:hypothetical protein